MKLARSVGLALLMLPAVAASPRAVPQSPFGDVTLIATPSKYEGACPVKIHFGGRVGIAVHPMVFNYTFERSDGAKSQLKVQRVTNPNIRVMVVGEDWQVGASGHYWIKLRVASGNTRIVSNEADADITCR